MAVGTALEFGEAVNHHPQITDTPKFNYEVSLLSPVAGAPFEDFRVQPNFMDFRKRWEAILRKRTSNNARQGAFYNCYGEMLEILSQIGLHQGEVDVWTPARTREAYKHPTVRTHIRGLQSYTVADMLAFITLHNRTHIIPIEVTANTAMSTAQKQKQKEDYLSGRVLDYLFAGEDPDWIKTLEKMIHKDHPQLPKLCLDRCDYEPRFIFPCFEDEVIPSLLPVPERLIYWHPFTKAALERVTWGLFDDLQN